MSIMSISNIIHLLLHNIWVVAQFGGHADRFFRAPLVMPKDQKYE